MPRYCVINTVTCIPDVIHLTFFKVFTKSDKKKIVHSKFPNPKCGIDKIHICFGNLCSASAPLQHSLQLQTVMNNIQLGFVDSFFVVMWMLA